MRDNQGLQADVELFQELLDRNVNETQMQHFFEEHPLFLIQARLGIPILHPLYSVPRRYAVDFAVTPVLGPVDGNGVEMLELKGPPEELLNTDKRHRGFSSKGHRAVDHVRDYSRYLKDPKNFERLPASPPKIISPRAQSENETVLPSTTCPTVGARPCTVLLRLKLAPLTGKHQPARD